MAKKVWVGRSERFFFLNFFFRTRHLPKRSVPKHLVTTGSAENFCAETSGSEFNMAAASSLATDHFTVVFSRSIINKLKVSGEKRKQHKFSWMMMSFPG